MVSFTFPLYLYARQRLAILNFNQINEIKLLLTN